MDINEVLQQYGLVGVVLLALVMVAQTINIWQRGKTAVTQAEAGAQTKINAAFERLDNERHTLQKRLDDVEAKMAFMIADNARLADELKSASTEITRLRSELDAVSKRTSEQDEAITTLKTQKRDVETQLDRERTTVAAQTVEINTLKRRVHELELDVARLSGANKALIDAFAVLKPKDVPAAQPTITDNPKGDELP